MTVISLEEIRALREQARQHEREQHQLQHATEQQRLELLTQMRNHVARINGADTLTDLHQAWEAPWCYECQTTIGPLYLYGRPLPLCRRCVTRRRARHHKDNNG